MKVETLHKKNKLSYKENKQLAKQLNCPNGQEGISIGKLMYESNYNMILNSFKAVEFNNRNRILEIGHGNCSHLNKIIDKAQNLKYFGLELSETMTNEAEQNNQNHVRERRALFRIYNGNKIPYVFNFFDRVVTINTIYFWENPKAFLNEIYRVLRPNGICVITFVNGDFMKNLPFINASFTLYNTPNFIQLISNTPFKLIDIKIKKEIVKSKSGKVVNREYYIATLNK